MTEPLVITEPGVFDMPAEDYHADPVPGGSLSSSGARKLLSPSCPALFAYEREHGQAHKQVWDIGHAAHKLVLGNGPDLVPIEGDYRTKANKEKRDQAYLDGAVPLKTDEFDMVHEMADAIREHPVASALFNPLGGRAEQSLFWVDDASQVWRRSRLDWLPFPSTGRRLIVPDYKTCIDASPDGIQKAAQKYGLHQQAAFYLDAIKALGLAEDCAFVFIFQMKTPPYLVTPVELTDLALQIGRDLNRQAIDIYRQCTETGVWPGFTDAIEYISLPGWVENAYLQEYAS